MKTLEKYYEQLRDWKLIQNCEAIDITGAAKWYWEESDQDEWNLYKDFPAVTPPFECTWLEYGNVKSVNVNGRVTVLPVSDWRAAAAIYTVRFPAEHESEVLEKDVLRRLLPLMLGVQRAIPGSHDPTYAESLKVAVAAGKRARWGMIMFLHTEDSPLIGKGFERIGASYFYLDELGVPIEAPIVPLIPLGKLQTVKPEYRARAADVLTSQIEPFFFALSLMNAKNVSLVDNPLSPAVAKRRAKDGKPALTFKVLKIDPMRAKAKAEAQPGESHIKRALHICRGHFKDYRNSGGLFGKYKGLYWWDSQVRGSDESGRIIKDYGLNAPTDH